MNLHNMRLERGQIVDQMKSLINNNGGSKWTDSIESQYNTLDRKQTQIRNQVRTAELDNDLNQVSDSAIKTGINSSSMGTGSADYKEAFLNLCRVGKNNAGISVLNALQVGTAAEGGNIVPTELDSMIVKYLQDFNEFRNHITVIPTTSDREIPIEINLGTAAWTAEEASYNESDPSFSKAVLSAHKLTRIVKVSEELVQDSGFDLMDYLGENFGKSFGLAEEAAIVGGTGTGQPSGFVSAATTGVTAAATTTVTGDEIISLYHSLNKAYRRNAVFTMNDSTLAFLRKLKDSSGQYLWQAGLQAGQPDTLLGKPVIATAAQSTMATGVNAISYGDLSYYYLAERSGRSIQVLSELYANNGQIGYRGFERIDGALVDTNAVKNLTMA